MIVKRTNPGGGPGHDQQSPNPSSEGKSNSPEASPANAADASAKYGIIGTQVSRD